VKAKIDARIARETAEITALTTKQATLAAAAVTAAC
jgi:hypothetical protein